MGRPLRFIPPDSLVEVTSRTVHGRFLLRPSRELNTIVYGILGRAARRYRVRICAFVYLSNHAHLLLEPANAYELAGFMAYVNGNLAKEAGRLHRWRERFWGRRYRAIVVSDDEEDQVGLLADRGRRQLVGSVELRAVQACSNGLRGCSAGTSRVGWPDVRAGKMKPRREALRRHPRANDTVRRGALPAERRAG